MGIHSKSAIFRRIFLLIYFDRVRGVIAIQLFEYFLFRGCAPLTGSRQLHNAVDLQYDYILY